MLINCILEEKESVASLKGELITWDFMVTGSPSEHHCQSQAGSGSLSPKVRLILETPVTVPLLEISDSTEGHAGLQQI